METIKKHVDTVIILGGILTSVLWMNHKFNSIEKDILVMKTVLQFRGIMTNEIAANAEVKNGI